MAGDPSPAPRRTGRRGRAGWARALGEFGATITFAGNLPGRTQTLPVATFVALESDPEAALALSLLLLVVAFGVLFAMRGRLGAR